ncbi:alcohol dehydrogenase [Arabiibacter massiliensis]|uniref:alcohol dehydrogenase n=1 Tax=Arabiibacter massiliensis TaxID=1870985 RepID=UPI001E467C10|nr:alcohol dehydrogenase [Arabiibacter massiliensis]
MFAGLIVLSLCGLGWYLFAGHSWNVAASNIDDTFGSMDGYTAIVYAGTEQTPVEPIDEDDAEPAAPAAPAEKLPEPLDPADVVASYEEKAASVLLLDTLDPSAYEEGSILKKGGRRFGVFSAEEPLTPRALKRMVAYFDEHKVDFVVAVVADKAYVEEAAGIDIVVSLQDEGLFVMGETIDGTFYVSAPEAGKVGAILVSPSNVVSAKVIEEL